MTPYTRPRCQMASGYRPEPRDALAEEPLHDARRFSSIAMMLGVNGFMNNLVRHALQGAMVALGVIKGGA